MGGMKCYDLSAEVGAEYMLAPWCSMYMGLVVICYNSILCERDNVAMRMSSWHLVSAVDVIRCSIFYMVDINLKPLFRGGGQSC